MTKSFELFHYWRSSCSWRVRWALNIKGIAYKSTPVNLLKGEHKSPTYLAMNPSAFVPTLMVDGSPMAESASIMEWLDETIPTPALLPQDSNSRAHVRQLMNTIQAGTQPIQNLAVQKYVSDDPVEKQKFACHWITKGFEVYEELLRRGNPGTYSFGAQITMADLCLIPQVYNANRFGVDMNLFPLIDGINKRCLATKECDDAVPENQPQ
jgi:maleylacetoacetate isomerase